MFSLTLMLPAWDTTSSTPYMLHKNVSGLHLFHGRHYYLIMITDASLHTASIPDVGIRNNFIRIRSYNCELGTIIIPTLQLE